LTAPKVKNALVLDWPDELEQGLRDKVVLGSRDPVVIPRGDGVVAGLIIALHTVIVADVRLADDEVDELARHDDRPLDLAVV
jgi:hypothetical protein